MAKRKAAKKAAPESAGSGLVGKLINFPQEWIERIEAERGELSFSDFVRAAVREKIGGKGLSEMPGWGKGRWKD